MGAVSLRQRNGTYATNGYEMVTKWLLKVTNGNGFVADSFRNARWKQMSLHVRVFSEHCILFDARVPGIGSALRRRGGGAFVAGRLAGSRRGTPAEQHNHKGTDRHATAGRERTQTTCSPAPVDLHPTACQRHGLSHRGWFTGGIGLSALAKGPGWLVVGKIHRTSKINSNATG